MNIQYVRFSENFEFLPHLLVLKVIQTVKFY